MAPSIPSRHHGKNRPSLKLELSQKVSQHPYSGAGKISQYLGIGKSAASKLQKSSSVGATYNPCACYNDPSTGLTGSYNNLSNSCFILINGETSGLAPMPLCIQNILL